MTTARGSANAELRFPSRRWADARLGCPELLKPLEVVAAGVPKRSRKVRNDERVGLNMVGGSDQALGSDAKPSEAFPYVSRVTSFVPEAQVWPALQSRLPSAA